MGFVLVFGLMAASLIALFGYGAFRLQGAAAPFAGAPVVRIVQANVQQSAKYDVAMFYDILGRYTRLTPSPQASSGGRPADLVIWPEGALPTAFEDYLAPGSWTACRAWTAAPGYGGGPALRNGSRPPS